MKSARWDAVDVYWGSWADGPRLPSLRALGCRFDAAEHLEVFRTEKMPVRDRVHGPVAVEDLCVVQVVE